MNLKVVIFFLAIFQIGNGYKILMIFPMASKSLHHLMSSLGLALAENGHNVTLFTSFSPFVTHKNIEHFQPDDFSKEMRYKNFFEVNSQAEILKWATGFMTKVPELIWSNERVWGLYNRRNEYDAIISTSYINEAFLPFLDGFKGSYVLVCTPGIEYNCLAYGGNWPSPAIVPNIALPFDEYMTFRERVYNSITFGVELVIGSYYIDSLLEKSLRNYFPNFRNLMEYYQRNDLTLINGHFSVDGPVPLLPNQIEIGTINARKPKPLSEELQKIFDEAGPEGVIYFSLGSFIDAKSMPQKNKEIFLEAFSQLPHKIIWKYEEEDLDLPPNVFVRKWLPQQDIFGNPKTKIFMSHCGNLGIQEAKYHGIPVLALPITFDQPRNAARLARKGHGVIVNWEDMTVDKLLEAVRILTENSTYYDRMKEVSTILQDQIETPSERAVWWIEYVIRHKGAPHLRYVGKNMSFLQYILMDVILFWSVVFALLCVALTFACRRMKRKLREIYKLSIS